MTSGQVVMLSQLTSWDDVPVGQMIRFTCACRVNLDDRDSLRRAMDYMKKNRGIPRFLIRSPEWESQLKHLLGVYARMQE